MDEPVTFRLLGPIEAWKGSRRIPLGGRRQRGVLAVLALRAGQVVTNAELVDAVWGESPPATSRQQLHSAISALRRALGGLIVTSQAGYQLAVPQGQIDAFQFHDLVAQARQAASGTDVNLAIDRFNEALALWSGPALGGIPSLRTLAVGLEERRLSALEDRIAQELLLGRDKDLVAELSVLVETHPIREGLIGQLMIALYRCGRAADALNVYRRAEQRLADDLGLYPGPELHQLELSVLRGDLDSQTPPADPPLMVRRRPIATPAHLPADLRSFVGRVECLAELDDLASHSRSPQAPPTVVVTGPPGVGKTVLAVHWAHRMAERFPDGQLYVDLNGFNPAGSPMAPADALRGFLDALAVPSRQIPSGPSSMVGLFRSLVADRRMIVVLDNARDAEQVRSLMPGTSGCLVLVTSRNQMSGLIAGNAAHPLRLDVLSTGEARELLTVRLGRRTAEEPRALDDIIASCARLPLALVNISARITTHPTFSLTTIADELRQRHNRLDVLSRVDQTTSVRAAFSSSYHQLRDAPARLFRLLGLHPDREVPAAAAASLAGVPIDQARTLLAELDAANMVNEYAPGRFIHNDLLRVYAAELTERLDTDSERRAAIGRVRKQIETEIRRSPPGGPHTRRNK